MSEQLLFLLKLCLLALLYLFFFRVLRAVWAEVRAPLTAPVAPAPASVVPKTDRRARREARRQARHTAMQLVVVEPVAGRGRSYPLGNEVTIGRAPGCQIIVDDTYVSQLHARVFVRDAQYFVEDLGSTNGTRLNAQRVGGSTALRKGDRIQVGNTVLELR